ncbi:hypothetical protein BB561_005954 [Smittium simulii]|uniref:dolichyl-phosphate-mannose--protein mannosyltransferase n=1 Tax=Smittium simulii TaxID=133385 RepID=A0A2T9Y7F0_9FUNG|nr:hypothetical protein BB561_005954 [Smittium simulii]
MKDPKTTVRRRPATQTEPIYYDNLTAGSNSPKETFYHDVHPPLAKMLVGLAEVVAGHNGTFNFKGDYPSYVNFTLIRAQITLYGVALVPIAFITCRAMGFSLVMAILGSSFILFDNALTVMTRYILLDPPLLFFTSTTLMFVVLFYASENFSREWYAYLSLTGISLGAVLSSKWVGLFCFGLVGFVTIEDLMSKFEDLNLSLEVQLKHWTARIFALILVPLVVYMCSFMIHFAILNKSGPGDSNMSAEFQATLLNNKLSNQAYLVAYGASLSIRSSLIGNGYLHSHHSKYPSGSLRQQVTCYGHDDNNGKWTIRRQNSPINYDYIHDSDSKLRQPDYVMEGDYVILEHSNTKKFLFMDYTKSLVTTKEFEASCNNYKEENKKYFLWKVVIVDDTGTRKSKNLRTISSKFILQNNATGEYLKARGTKLPEWGFDQMEVTGDKYVKSDAFIWTIEKNVHELVPATQLPINKPNFLTNFWRINLQMAKTNSDLVPDKNKYNHLESDPITWPFLMYPMRMFSELQST